MKVVSIVVNNPLFIQLQYQTLKKFMECDYEFIIFNDAKSFPDATNEGDVTLREKISELCKSLNVQCINIPNEHHKKSGAYSQRHVDSSNFLLKYQLEHPDKYLILDSDMFLINYFNISQFDEYDAAIILQERCNRYYIWPNFYYIDFTKIKNKELLKWDIFPGADSGAMSYLWLQKQCTNPPTFKEICESEIGIKKDKILFMKHLYSCSWSDDKYPENFYGDKLLQFLKQDPRNVNHNFFFEIYAKKFLHYRAGSGWIGEGLNFHKNLSTKLYELLMFE
jgi:hypothetical protein